MTINMTAQLLVSGLLIKTGFPKYVLSHIAGTSSTFGNSLVSGLSF